MIHEDDTEVILEGGELYKYLKSQGELVEDVYPSSKKGAEPLLMAEKLPNKNSSVVPTEVANIVHNILNSGLLLEEDATYLFKTYSELDVSSPRRMSSKLKISGMMLGISGYGYWKFNSVTILSTSFLACSTAYLFYELYNLFSHHKVICKINTILLELKEISACIRKHIKLLQEEDSLLHSKGKFQQQRNVLNMINEHTINRKHLEIYIISQKLIFALKTLILLSRNITLTVLRKKNFKLIDSNLSFIALFSEEQLGINKCSEEMDEGTNALPLIDLLRNVYIVIQSETLRELGLYLCGFRKIEEVTSLVTILNQYSSKSTETLLVLKKMYEKYFYPSYIPRKTKSDNKNSRYLGNIINSISLSLNSLLNDSRKLEDLIDNSNDIDLNTNQNDIALKLLKMEREIGYLVEHIHLSALQFLRQTNYFNQNTNCLSFDKKNEKTIKNKCMVGVTDFSISGKDEVFLGFVEGSENPRNDYDYVTECEKPANLGIVLNELKYALISKREEFEKRELRALKSPEDIENYRLWTTESCKVPLATSKTESSPTIDQYDLSENSEEFNSFIPLDKVLASKASDLLKSWNKKTNDECFGDSTDDDENI